MVEKIGDTMNIKDLCTQDEVKEAQAVGKLPLKLQYLGKMKWSEAYNIDSRMWNVLSPKLPGYTYDGKGWPTFTLTGLKERGLI
jgi:hypothetical protein